MESPLLPTVRNTHLVEFPEIAFTEYALSDVVRILYLENIVVLVAGRKCRAFHNLSENHVNLSNRQVVYVDCSSNPKLLDANEWSAYLLKEVVGITEILQGDSLAKAITEETVDHKLRLYVYKDERENPRLGMI